MPMVKPGSWNGDELPLLCVGGREDRKDTLESLILIPQVNSGADWEFPILRLVESVLKLTIFVSKSNIGNFKM